jgi:decaprenyl-phosphate phosphoribosyltransferase
MHTLKTLFVAARPRQWVKNAALFIPFIFNELLLNPTLIWRAFLGVVVFCLLSSSNYLINDILDAPSDRRHPYKSRRPIASGKLPVKIAFGAAIIMAIVGLILSYYLGINFLWAAAAFVTLHYLSFFILRRISVIDVLAIASGYLIRVWAGEIVTGYHMSVWLFLAILSFSLLLALGKRRAELTYLTSHAGTLLISKIKKPFPYTEKVLDAYVAMFANATYLTYAYFTFLTSVSSIQSPDKQHLGTIFDRKWLMATIPFVIYGVMRYLQLIYSAEHGSMEKALFEDKPLIITMALWISVALVVVYGIG